MLNLFFRMRKKSKEKAVRLVFFVDLNRPVQRVTLNMGMPMPTCESIEEERNI